MSNAVKLVQFWGLGNQHHYVAIALSLFKVAKLFKPTLTISLSLYFFLVFLKISSRVFL